MSGKEDTAGQSLQESLYARMQDVNSLDSVAELLDEALASCAAIGVQNAFRLARSLCSLAIDFAETEPSLAADFIVSHVIPWSELSESSTDKDDHLDVETYRMRDVLNNWIYGYPFEQMREIRRTVLEETLKRLKSDPRKQRFWLISKIGFKTKEIEEFLWNSVTDQSEFADTALSTLIALGPNPEEQTRILEVVSAQLNDGQLSPAARLAVQELVGPIRIDIAERLLSLGVEQCVEDKRGELSIVISVVTRAVDRSPEDDSVHDRVWRIIRKHPRIVSMSGEYGFRCSTGSAVLDTANWLVKGQLKEGSDTGAYILLTRLADLVKPRHLSAWDEIPKTEVSELLTRFAAEDTKIEGQWATTSFRLKTESVETLLSLGDTGVGPLINDAVLNETNAYVSNDIARILACLEVQQLPESLLAWIVSARQVDKTDDLHFFRQEGLIELARASGSGEALEAMLQFGYLHKGEVLLSTVTAITDLVVARIRKGDLEAVEKLIDAARNGQHKHHRDASASAFCTLSKHGFITGDKLQLLWDFANDLDLHEITRCEALEAIGITHFNAAKVWADKIRKLAHDETDEIGWRAWEVLIRRRWLQVDDEEKLFQRIDVAHSGNLLRVKSPHEASDWQGFLLGLLYRNDERRYRICVADLVRGAKLEVVYQLVGCLRHHGTACSPEVSSALASRIELVNNQAMADTGLFDVLASIAPERLLMLGRNTDQQRWMVEARVAHCEAVRTVADADSDFQRLASETLVAFMNDAAFQVRRSAYRALSEVSEKLLASTCHTWSQSTDVELRKRAAEAAAWLSYEFSDQRLSEFGFEWDDEPAVRSTWKGKILERRKRHWANKYVQRILRECREGNQAVAENHRYARAIAKIGDDDSIHRINEFMSGQILSPSVRNWLQKTVKETDKQWKQTTAKWPEPWSHESGSIETVNGSIRLSDGTQLNANLTLWRQQRLGQSDRYSWGGIAENIDGNPNVLNDEGLELVVPGRETSKILCHSSSWGGRGSRISFSGNAAYPGPKQAISAGETSVLVDEVAKLIREANADVSMQAAKSISEQLQPLLARAELPKKGAIGATKEADHFILQDVALVVRNAGEHVPPTEIGTFTLWRIATLLLEQHEMTLRLSTREFEEFARLVRSNERESLEELLSWLKAQSIEREIAEPHSEDPSL